MRESGLTERMDARTTSNLPLATAERYSHTAMTMM